MEINKAQKANKLLSKIDELKGLIINFELHGQVGGMERIMESCLFSLVAKTKTYPHIKEVANKMIEDLKNQIAEI